MGPQAIAALMEGMNLPHIIVSCFGLWLLVKYSLNRKWPKDHLEARFKGPLLPLVLFIRYRVEIIIAGVLVPQWATWVPNLFQ